MATPSAGDLTKIELLVLDDAGGCNHLGCAYGDLQLYAVFQREDELLDAVENALLRLFDLGLIRLVEATEDEGYRGDHNELSAMSRDALKAELARERDPTDTHRTR